MGVDRPRCLDHLRVIDLAGPPGQFCTRIFALLGADVVKVEPPGGDPARSIPPFAGDIPHPERSLYFFVANLGKRSVVLDLHNRADREAFLRLVDTADVVVETFPPGYLESLGLSYEQLRARNPGLVMTSITPFGLRGPYSRFKGNDLVAQAMGGLMFIQGDDQKPPCAAPCEQAYQLGAVHAAIGTLAALYVRRRTGQGQRVEVALQEVVAHVDFPLLIFAALGDIKRRTGARALASPDNYYPCRDGVLCLSAWERRQWTNLVEWLGNELLRDPKFYDLGVRREFSDMIDAIIQDFLSNHPLQEALYEAQKRRLPSAPFYHLYQYVQDPQARERGVFVSVGHPEIGEVRLPRPGFLLSATPAVVGPAPLLGQHQQEVLAQLQAPAPRPNPHNPGHQGGRPRLPLEGIRVVDFTRVWAGPYATRFLADLGAQVIKIESAKFPAPDRWPGPGGPRFPEINRSKLSITLDLHTPEAQELVKRLVAVSDVVAENFGPGVMERWGLDYETLRRVKPDIIMLRMPGFGNSGPYRNFISYGLQLMAYVGMTDLWRHPGTPLEALPRIHYPDFLSAAEGAMAVLAALEHRNRTGRGQVIELAQAEATAFSMALGFMDYFVNGRVWEPRGNTSPHLAPHNTYPCRGDDAWCVIVCTTEEEWQALCRAMGRPELAEDPRFATNQRRLQNREVLDRIISEWTQELTPFQVFLLLQRAGVPAGAVQTGEDLYRDINLRHRGYIVGMEHPDWGWMEQPGLTTHLWDTPAPLNRPVPPLGGHNDLVFRQVLGLTEEEFRRFSEQGAIG